MTADKKRKRVIRDRMAKTGETYGQALRAILAEQEAARAQPAEPTDAATTTPEPEQ